MSGSLSLEEVLRYETNTRFSFDRLREIFTVLSDVMLDIVEKKLLITMGMELPCWTRFITASSISGA